MILPCIVSKVMSRNEFQDIKSKWKLSKLSDENKNDKVKWRVRKIIDIFRKNIQQFGFFCPAISVDTAVLNKF